MNDLMTLELKIARFLRIGVVFSGMLMLAGMIASFGFETQPISSFKNYSELSLLLNLQLNVMAGNWAMCLSYLGLFSLICLPVIRVFLTMYLFIRQKEYLLAGVAALVLAGLFLSFTFGIEL